MTSAAEFQVWVRDLCTVAEGAIEAGHEVTAILVGQATPVPIRSMQLVEGRILGLETSEGAYLYLRPDQLRGVFIPAAFDPA